METRQLNELTVTFSTHKGGPNTMWLSGIFGFVLGTVLTAVYHWKQIQKIGLESIKLAGEHLQKVQESRQAYNDANDRMRTELRTLDKHLREQASAETIIDTRNDVCAVFNDQVIPRFAFFMQWEHLDRKSSSRDLELLVDNWVCPELERFEKWLTVINRVVPLDELNKAPYRISKRTLEPIRAVVKGISHDKYPAYLSKVDTRIEQLTGA